MDYERCIKTATDLITAKEETRLGFINYAAEKNNCAKPYLDNAKAFFYAASAEKSASELIENPNLRIALLTAAGLSDKSLQYLTEGDQLNALKNLRDNFLIPAGEEFPAEATYLYLLNKGESLGGSTRNIVGSLAQQKLIRALISNMNILDIDYKWIHTNNTDTWFRKSEFDRGIETQLKVISWSYEGRERTLAFNLTVPLVNRNTNICLFDCNYEKYNKGQIAESPERTIMLGELKGGIDPAGADEHWKAANTSLERIRQAYADEGLDVRTSFLGAAIERKMADEIFDQLKSGKLTCAANITNEKQLNSFCGWILSI